MNHLSTRFASLKRKGRASLAAYIMASDPEASFKILRGLPAAGCARLEGILPALEPSHALARLGDVAKDVGKGGLVIINLCGRGDKDVFTVADALGVKL